MKKQHYQIWDQVPVNYYQKGISNNLFQKIWHTTKISNIKNILKTVVFKNCLDVGCASGFTVSEIARDFPVVKYFGVDIYDKAIDYARKNYPDINFQVADAQKLPFKNNSFDLVINIETIEHIENPFKALKEMRRVLKKGSTAIVSMDSGSILFRIVWIIWENTTGSVWKGAHLHPFKHSQLEKLIKKSGFKIRQKTFSFLGMEVTFVLSK